MTAPSIKQIAEMLNARIADLAHDLLGEHNRQLSSPTQLRFGTHGSIAVELQGDQASCWFDHELGVGGDGLELIKTKLGVVNGEAYAWARKWLGVPAYGGHAPRVLPPPPTHEEPPPSIPDWVLEDPPDAQGDEIEAVGDQDGPLTETPSSSPNDNDAAQIEGRLPWVSKASGKKTAKKTAEDAQRAEKVAAFVRDGQDPCGTCVETYLQNRSITASALPASIRFVPNAYNHYGALLALATDAEGTVHGLQLIYLTDDGHKAPLHIQKRTNKAHDSWSDVSAVRMPGTPPLVLCEGVETALSVWQATGRETWACLGISNIAKAPIPEGARVIIARDGDPPNSKADLQIRRAVNILRKRGHEVTVAEPPIGFDFNDVLQNDGEEAIRTLLAITQPAAVFSSDWRKDLLHNLEGEPRPVVANAITALRGAPEWQGVLWHNEFATTTVARKPPPWIPRSLTPWIDTPWSDRDDALVADWLQHQEIMVPMSIAGQAIEVVSRDQTFHPVREYLDRLTWDGVPRLETWLLTYIGADDTPYNRAVGLRWMISAVARIYLPGCKADCALILEGPQGIRKSSALMALAEPWFTDRLSDLGSKDAAMETRGVWIIEVAELDTMGRAEVSTIKAFMSRTQDRFRPPYGKRLVDLPRQCVFAGSVNPEGGYLKDPTGGRRFWPVVCGTIDIPALTRDKDQFWAEARHRFQAKEPWWLETQELDALAATEQAERYQGDAWEDPIQLYIDNDTRWLENGRGEQNPHHSPRSAPLTDVSVADILEQALGIEKGRWTQADQNRVVRCLVSMGFKQCRARDGGHGKGGKRQRRYRRDTRSGGAQ